MQEICKRLYCLKGRGSSKERSHPKLCYKERVSTLKQKIFQMKTYIKI